MLFESAPPFENETARQYFEHSSAPRVNTDAVIVEAIRREYPRLHLSVVPQLSCNLLAYCSAGHAAAAPLGNEKDSLTWKQYVPAARRLNGLDDGLAELVLFGKYLIDWHGQEFVLYVVNGRDGSASYPIVQNQYVLSAGTQPANNLIMEAGRWTNELHDEVWVYDQSRWQKSRELWESVQHSEWADVILDEDMKKAIIKDVDNFFDGRDTYTKLKVPWKRGVIYYGPPGNGKTISIKAMMHALSKRKDAIPTLYVRTLASFAGPEYSLGQIFGQARRFAPCYLIFEDLDTIITPNVRSYFFNEVDGLKSNDGIFMVGSTNHLDELDPGIAKRPSRFDRKYLFPDPNEEQRTQYAKYWQGKLKDNKDLDYPDSLCSAFAKITDGFSFAYMQEAFVAALLAIAAREGEPDVASTAEVEQPDVNPSLSSLPHRDKSKRTLPSDQDEAEPIMFETFDRTFSAMQQTFRGHTIRTRDIRRHRIKLWHDGVDQDHLQALRNEFCSSSSNLRPLPDQAGRVCDSIIYAQLTTAEAQFISRCELVEFIQVDEGHYAYGRPLFKDGHKSNSLDNGQKAVIGAGARRQSKANLDSNVVRHPQGIILQRSSRIDREEGGRDLEELVLWKELKKQVKILREESDLKAKGARL